MTLAGFRKSTKALDDLSKAIEKADAEITQMRSECYALQLNALQLKYLLEQETIDADPLFAECFDSYREELAADDDAMGGLNR
jgi:hypothetical protein